MITVVRPGMLTTVQDLGRWGYQHLGVPVGGPMDEYSHRLANHLVGNVPGAAALETTLMGPELQTDAPITCAVCGARFALRVNGTPVPLDAPFDVPAGGRVRFGERSAGARATLAIRGGIDVALDHGSRSTSLLGRMGPFGGRPLRAGDVLPVGIAPAGLRVAAGARTRGLPLPDGGSRLRVVPGPHAGSFEPSTLAALYAGRFTVSTTSNRTGYRLDGPPLTPSVAGEILSGATPIGSLQVPGSGQPILLMADRQTTGGYPRIAVVIGADLPLAGQLAPGDWVELLVVSRQEARVALTDRFSRLETLDD